MSIKTSVLHILMVGTFAARAEVKCDYIYMQVNGDELATAEKKQVRFPLRKQCILSFLEHQYAAKNPN